MKTLKSHPQIERPHCTKNRISHAKQRAGLVLALICLTCALALPTYCRTRRASNQITTQSATNSGWTTTGDLNLNHYNHTATLLPNGKVLVAGGGYTVNSSAPRAELYDPATGSWSNTGSLSKARMSHTATLLQNGQVLVAGGLFQRDSAELYDPATEQWRPTGSFRKIRAVNSATLLPNGKVLAVGASLKETYVVDSAELYDPATGTWSSTSAPSPSAGWSTVPLPNGKVLAVSGHSAELYDPNTERWSNAGTLNTVGITRTVTLLRNGKVLVTGWSGSGSYPLGAELYDPATGTWSITGNLNAARGGEAYTATLLADGRVLVAGGYASYDAVSGEELYDPATGTWSFTGRLIAARDYHTATVLQNGKVLIAGGLDGSYEDSIFLNGAELYDPATGPIPMPRIISASVAGKNLLILGENFDPGAVILLNGKEQKTKHDGQNPETTLIGKKVGKKVKPGDKLQVQNPNGTLSEEFTFTGS